MKSIPFFIFDHRLALRSYRDTGVLRNWVSAEDSNFAFIGEMPPEVESNFGGFMNLQLSRWAKFCLAYNAHLYWVQKSDRSLSFKLRVSRHRFEEENKLFTWYIYKFLLLTRVKIPMAVMSFFLRNLGMLLTRYFDGQQGIVLYVTSGGSTSLNDYLSNFAARHNLTFVTLLENWDNVSSKAVFNVTPDAIGVWGKQSSNLGKNIHEQIPKSVWREFGNPRVYWLDQHLKFSDTQDYFLFAGGSVDLKQEISYIFCLSQKLKEFKSDKVVFYLPHPKNYLRIPVLYEKFRDLGILYPRVGENDILSPMNFQLPSLETYLELFSKSWIVFSPLSTMNIEAGILGVPTVGIDFELRGNNFHASGRVSSLHDHLSDAVASGRLKTVGGLNEFSQLIANLLLNHKLRDRYIFDEESKSYFYHRQGKIFDLNEILAKIELKRNDQ